MLKHKKIDTASTTFSIIPFPNDPACIIREKHGPAFVAQGITSQMMKSTQTRASFGLPGALAACITDSSILVCVNKSALPLRKNRLVGRVIAYNQDRTYRVAAENSKHIETGRARENVHLVGIKSDNTTNQIIKCTFKKSRAKLTRYASI